MTSPRLTCPHCHQEISRQELENHLAGEANADPLIGQANSESLPASSADTTDLLLAAPSARPRARPPRKKKWIAVLFCAGMLAAALGIGYYSRKLTEQEHAAAQPQPIPAHPTPPNQTPADPQQPGEKPRQPDPQPLAGTSVSLDPQVLKLLDAAVVKIETTAATGDTGLGSGFVIDADQGLIVTNYHVIDDASSAVVRLKDGSKFAVAGYAAFAPKDDLALLKLEGRPLGLQSLKPPADETLAAQSPVVAIGHPRELAFSLFDGKVSQLLRTRQMPLGSRRLIARLMDEQANHTWIQHTARLSEGNSGGPLINPQGEVLGVNTWVDRGTGFNYALHARHVRDLLKNRLPAVVPLERYARPDVRLASIRARMTPAHVQKLYATMKEIKWQPRNDDEFQQLQELAWLVTFTQTPGSWGIPNLLPEQEREPLIKAVDRIVSDLGKQKWDNPGLILLVNEAAARNLETPLAGLFFFATVERVVQGPDSQQGLILKLAGQDRPIFVPQDGQLITLEKGNSCLVLGVNYQGQVVRYGDNPLAPTVAPVILSRTILPLNP